MINPPGGEDRKYGLSMARGMSEKRTTNQTVRVELDNWHLNLKYNVCNMRKRYNR